MPTSFTVTRFRPSALIQAHGSVSPQATSVEGANPAGTFENIGVKRVPASTKVSDKSVGEMLRSSNSPPEVNAPKIGVRARRLLSTTLELGEPSPGCRGAGRCDAVRRDSAPAVQAGVSV